MQVSAADVKDPAAGTDHEFQYRREFLHRRLAFLAGKLRQEPFVEQAGLTVHGRLPSREGLMLGANALGVEVVLPLTSLHRPCCVSSV